MYNLPKLRFFPELIERCIVELAGSEDRKATLAAFGAAFRVDDFAGSFLRVMLHGRTSWAALGAAPREQLNRRER
jgi:hypothetical protein